MKLQVLSMYLWLSHHFDESDFPHVEKAENMAADVAKLLGSSLARACWKPQSRQQVNRNKKNDVGEDVEEKEGRSIKDGRRDGHRHGRSFVEEFVM
jgi:ATP-dependent RNA helicase SUPV3L1/SUV3